jgi:hypothetical protein
LVGRNCCAVEHPLDLAVEVSEGVLHDVGGGDGIDQVELSRVMTGLPASSSGQPPVPYLYRMSLSTSP